MRTALLVILALSLTGAVFALQSPEDPGVERHHSVFIEMRDGVELATDIYMPTNVEGPFPTLILRTPYGKRSEQSFGLEWASRGYVAIVQDVRGRYESHGDFTVSAGDVNDGYDLIDWITQQAWSNGRVGAYGCSYPGIVNARMVNNPHPALKTMILQGAGGAMGAAHDRYRYFGVYNGGVPNLNVGVSWFSRAGMKHFTQLPEDLDRETYLSIIDQYELAPARPSPDDLPDMWSTLPTARIMDAPGIPPNDWEAYISTPLDDPWWDELGYLSGDETVTMPVLHINSWYDYAGTDTTLMFQMFQDNAVSEHVADNQFLIMAAGNHCAFGAETENTLVGELSVGDARFDYASVYDAWFSHWLMEAEATSFDMPTVQYYDTGAQQWHEAESWPPTGAEPLEFFLYSETGANGLSGDGLLLTALSSGSGMDQFVYDPEDPVPSLGGPICCMGPDTPAGSYEQSDIERRDDVLVYSSPPLEESLTLAGPVSLTLYVRSSARDTDFTGKLVDVHPDGSAYNLQEGILRARYRDGFDHSVFFEGDEVVELTIDLQAMAHEFQPGHSIRLEVSSSNFPRFERNLNTGGNNYDESEGVVAINQVMHGSGYPSRLEMIVLDSD